MIEVTGPGNPCRTLDVDRPGLMAAVLDRDADGGLLRKAGVMAIVPSGDRIEAEVPEPPHTRPAPV